MERAGRLDISFNAVGVPDTKIVGVPLVELDLEQFALPISTYATTYFLTARLAARRMVANGSGLIMTVTALHSRTGLPLVGGYGPAQAVKESLTRSFSPSSPHRAFAWSVRDRKACPRRARSSEPSSLAPRQRERPGKGGKSCWQAGPTRDGS
jgi:hypothetical protein